MGMFSSDETWHNSDYYDLLDKYKNKERQLEESRQTVHKCVDIIRELQLKNKELEEICKKQTLELMRKDKNNGKEICKRN